MRRRPDPERMGDLRLRLLESVDEAELRAAIRTHQQALLSRGPEVVLARPWRSVTRVPIGSQSYAIKEYRHNALRKLAALFPGGARADAANRGHELLGSARLSRAPLAALGVEYQSGLPSVSYAITSWVAGVGLRDAFREVGRDAGPGPRPPWIRLTRLCLDYLTAMHAAGLTMDDFHTPNFVGESGDDGGLAVITMVDFDTVRRVRLTWEHRLYNLFTLRRSFGKDLSEDGLRFLRNTYLDHLGVPHDSALGAALLSSLRPFIPRAAGRRHVVQAARELERIARSG